MVQEPQVPPGAKRAKITLQDHIRNDGDRDSDSGSELHIMDHVTAAGSTGEGPGAGLQTIERKRENSVNESEDGSVEPGTPSPNHTPPRTPALTPQRVDTPVPENLSLRKSGSPLNSHGQNQMIMQPVDLVQPRHISPPSPSTPSLAAAAAVAAAAHFSPYAPLYGPTANSLYCSPATLYQHQHHTHHLHEPREIQMQMQMQMQNVQQPCGLQIQQQQQQQPQQQRSPVDVLLRVFPGRRRADVEALLHRCKGDVVSAMEVLVCEDSLQPKSAFSPLAGALASAAAASAASASVTAAYVSRAGYCGPTPPTRHRFLAAPYTGTGYLPTVIRPPNQNVHANGTADNYRETSPDDASDKTSYSE
ncbi:doublesex- and mab-3-related transcription factor A2-like [Venturia canescens]|uniref:doublesex- and mab-3-related transcription factor A2-like n=1 Tax=Venturia canescens TaxID=32260 RepID=UPI001C9BF91C|nr:doublesex- and mab-3-related transcription factor A2-like [Venturia canescens]